MHFSILEPSYNKDVLKLKPHIKKVIWKVKRKLKKTKRRLKKNPFFTDRMQYGCG